MKTDCICLDLLSIWEASLPVEALRFEVLWLIAESAKYRCLN